MDKKRLDLKIITPRGVKIEQKAKMLIMRCINGDMGVLPGHEATSVVMGDGILRIIDDEPEKKIAVFGGVATIENDTVNILTSIAQRPGDIDLIRAETDREQLEVLIQERADDLKMQSYQVMLRRALVRIEVSVHPEDEEV